jgi:hypothetical protein
VCDADYPDLYSNTHERVAVQALTDYNRVGGVFAGTTPADIQAQNVKLQEQIAALTQRLDDADTVVGVNKVNNYLSGLKLEISGISTYKGLLKRVISCIE